MKTNFNYHHADSIESTINTVAALLTAISPAGTFVEKKTTVKGKCCKGMITVTPPRKENIKDEDVSAYISVNQPNSKIGSTELNPDKASQVTYVFYASTYSPSQLGSVAIYAKETATILSLIRRSRSLFGFRVIDATIEHGRRPFIDVTLALKAEYK